MHLRLPTVLVLGIFREVTEGVGAIRPMASFRVASAPWRPLRQPGLLGFPRASRKGRRSGGTTTLEGAEDSEGGPVTLEGLRQRYGADCPIGLTQELLQNSSGTGGSGAAKPKGSSSTADLLSQLHQGLQQNLNLSDQGKVDAYLKQLESTLGNLAGGTGDESTGKDDTSNPDQEQEGEWGEVLFW